MLNIAILDDYQRIAEKLVDWNSIPDSRVSFFSDSILGHHELITHLRPYEVLVTMRERTELPRSVLEALPKLRFIAGTGRAQNHVDIPVATSLGIPVCGTEGGSSGISTAELTWALILACFRQLPKQNDSLRQGKWQTDIGHIVSGKTLGVLGLGRIGTRVASIGQAFGMSVKAWGPTLTENRAADHGVMYVPWERLFEDADVLTVHARLTDTSRGWITFDELSKMKRTAYLINTARSALIDQEDLLRALRTGVIAGAGLDVYDQEPLPLGHPLLTLGNVVLTPHLGYATVETLTEFYEQVIANIKAWQIGSPTNVLNPEALQSVS